MPCFMNEAEMLREKGVQWPRENPSQSPVDMDAGAEETPLKY